MLNDISIRRQNLDRELQQKARTPLVIGLQTLEMQRVIPATDLLSLFDAELQKRLSCTNGFGSTLKFVGI